MATQNTNSREIGVWSFISQLRTPNSKLNKSMFRKFSPFNFSAFAGIISAAFLLSSCGGGDDENVIKDYEETTDTISSQVRVNFDLLRVSIPPPGTLTKKLSVAKINYNKNVMLSSSKGGSFSSTYQKAIGMGAFGADLGFAASYNQSNDALEYLTQIGKLAGDLGIGNAFDPEFSKQLLLNIEKPDTFNMMLDEAFDKAEKNLRSNQRVAISVLMVTGGWVESIFTTVESLNSNPTDPNTKSIYYDISVHCNAFEYVFKLLEAYKSNADCAKLLQDMEPFKAQLIGVGKNPKIGPSDLPKIRETITALRNKITS